MDRVASDLVEPVVVGQLSDLLGIVSSASALGHWGTFSRVHAMSALPPKADMCSALAYVCFGP